MFTASASVPTGRQKLYAFANGSDSVDTALYTTPLQTSSISRRVNSSTLLHTYSSDSQNLGLTGVHVRAVGSTAHENEFGGSQQFDCYACPMRRTRCHAERQIVTRDVPILTSDEQVIHSHSV